MVAGAPWAAAVRSSWSANTWIGCSVWTSGESPWWNARYSASPSRIQSGSVSPASAT